MSRGMKIFLLFCLLPTIVMFGVAGYEGIYDRLKPVEKPPVAFEPPKFKAVTINDYEPALSYDVNLDAQNKTVTGIVTNDPHMTQVFEFVYMRVCFYDKDDVLLQFQDAKYWNFGPGQKWKFVMQGEPATARIKLCTAFSQRY